MEEGRIKVDPVKCKFLAEAFRECELKVVAGRRKPYGVYAHVTDAAGYVLWWLEPKPKAPVADRPGIIPIQVARRGSDYY
jgi:hypothetical protein